MLRCPTVSSTRLLSLSHFGRFRCFDLVQSSPKGQELQLRKIQPHYRIKGKEDEVEAQTEQFWYRLVPVFCFDKPVAEVFRAKYLIFTYGLWNLPAGAIWESLCSLINEIMRENLDFCRERPVCRLLPPAPSLVHRMHQVKAGTPAHASGNGVVSGRSHCVRVHEWWESWHRHEFAR